MRLPPHPALLALLLGAALGINATASAQVCSETPTPLTTLNAVSGCSQCTNVQMPGAISAASTETSWTLISDLPEVFCSPGVLYASTPVLPPDPNGNPPLSLRTQHNPYGAFQYINGPFDVFLFHTVSSCSPSNPDKRIVIYVENIGGGSVTINPRQILVSDGTIGNIHQMESGIGERELQNSWDQPLGSSVSIPAGQGKVVAYSKRFASSTNNADQSTNLNCFGRVRAQVTSAVPGNPTQLRVYVVAIDGAAASQNDSRAAALLMQSARSGEGSIDLNTAPSGCQIRRATGTHPTFTWKSSPITMDVSSIAANTSTNFQMAMWDLSSGSCPTASQTADMSLYPGYTRGDSIGNYHVEYWTRFRLINKDTISAKTVDLKFAKSAADVGLAWQIVTGATPPIEAAVRAATVRAGWAGPNQPSTSRSLLTSDGGPITLLPCEAREVAVRFLVLGNSSLPFTVNVERQATASDIIVDNLDSTLTSSTGTWSASANAGFYGTNSYINQAPTVGTGGADRFNWHPNIPEDGRYQIYAWWVASAVNRSASAPYKIQHHGGPTVVPANQTINGGQWNLLGTYDLRAGPTYVELSDAVASSLYVSADAIRWVKTGPFVPVAVSGWELQ